MQVALDSPADRLLVNRVEMLSGAVSPVRGEATLRARCGGREVLLGPCFHPRRLRQPDVQGFFGYLMVQQHLDAVVEGCLSIELECGGEALVPLVLRVSPVARDLAERCPLDLAMYPVPRAAGAASDGTRRLVFPGLGGVGGASLNQLFRRKMLEAGGAVTAYSEADAPSLWCEILAAGAPDYRWVDGHACYSAANDLGEGSARVTLLRDPVRRLVSVFHYNSLVHPESFPYATLADFVGSGAARRFTQAAGLARLAGFPVDDRLPDAELRVLAATELERSYAVVGTTERFEETIFLLCALAGFDSIGMWWRILAAPKPVDVERLPSRLRAAIERVVDPDLRLYDDVARKLVARIAECGFGVALERYAAAAARQPELSDRDKFVECLRWRQVLTDAERAAWRAQ